MAGLDGIANRIDPGAAMDKDLYDLPKAELREIPTVYGSLCEALDSLKADHAYLTACGVFTQDLIESYVELNMAEMVRFEMTPHPVEYDTDYSV